MKSKVLIRTEEQKTKDNPKFKEEGVIVDELGYDTYLVKSQKRKPFKRHISQLKVLKGGECGRREC